jgi:DNA-binding SARP family transcriptional activator
LDEALRLWRGPAFATLDTPWLTGVRHALDRQRLAAELDRNDLALRLGRHSALLADLSAAAAAHPLDERLTGQLMLALYRSGRQADALAHYQQLRVRLADELGADPGPPLQQLHRQILTADPTLAAPTPVVARPARPQAEPSLPRQLPAPLRSFTGRARELDQLDAVLDTAGEQAPAVVISAVSGTAGVGKTALAVHWAHRVADRFPDGQLYVNLRGFDPTGSVMDPAEALRGFLDAFAVPPQRIPTRLDAQAALYRSLLADRQMLIMLDNAHDTEQIRPLLPGTRSTLVLVTSRSQLTGLVAAEGADPVTLDLLSADDARQLLAARLGASRVAAEPQAVDDIITSCARLLLALAIVAARAATHRRFGLDVLANELHEAHGRLDALTDTEDASTDIRAVFSWSYRRLSPDAAKLFRLLGLHPGPDVSAAAAAQPRRPPGTSGAAAVGPTDPRHLITERTPGRYTFHDLLRSYALITQTRKATDDESAVTRLDEALGLWRGEAFATVDTPWFNNVRAAVDKERLAAELDRNDLALRLGRHAGLLADLSAAGAAHPLDERLAGQLMLALYRSGRQADALAHYQQLRLRLADELGADPRPPLQHLHQQILTAAPTLAAPTPVVAQPSLEPGGSPPRQLPAPPRSFTGRTNELAHLEAVLDAAGERPAAVGVASSTPTARAGPKLTPNETRRKMPGPRLPPSRDRYSRSELPIGVDISGYSSPSPSSLAAC